MWHLDVLLYIFCWFKSESGSVSDNWSERHFLSMQQVQVKYSNKQFVREITMKAENFGKGYQHGYCFISRDS